MPWIESQNNTAVVYLCIKSPAARNLKIVKNE